MLRPSILLACLSSTMLTACIGTITGLTVSQTVKPGQGEFGENTIIRGTVATFAVTGTGNCDMLDIDFGDGTSKRVTNLDFNNGNAVPIEHTYRGWPGPKKIKATGVAINSSSSCTGTATLAKNVAHSFANPIHTQQLVTTAYAVGEAQGFGVQACSVLGGFPPLRAGAKVTVSEMTNSDGSPSIKINFGCAASGCIYGMAGQPGSYGEPNYPYPGPPKYSLIARVGAQTFAVGAQGSFVLKDDATLPAPLELCMNDNNPADNAGGWLIDLFVEE